MQIKLSNIEDKDRAGLNRMLLTYFKEIDDSKIVQINGREEIDYPFLELYWKEENRIAVNLLYQEKIIGFALINDWIVSKAFKANKSIAEFYIIPEWRRKGMGKKAAYELFDTYKGKWEIRQSSTNSTAIKFWREIIKAYTNDHFIEIKNRKDNNIEFVQLFES